MKFIYIKLLINRYDRLFKNNLINNIELCLYEVIVCLMIFIQNW